MGVNWPAHAHGHTAAIRERRAVRVVDAVCCVYTCRRLIDLSP